MSICLKLSSGIYVKHSIKGPGLLVNISVPMDLDVKVKATLLCAVFLIVSVINYRVVDQWKSKQANTYRATLR